jgi:hypothetical protein
VPWTVAIGCMGKVRVEHTGNDGPVPSPNDHRMWRLLLARLHPDAGGDHELFVFASTVKNVVCDTEPLKPRAAHPTLAYLRLWQTIMNPWGYAPFGAAHSRRKKF